jgi:hypothetical protein
MVSGKPSNQSARGVDIPPTICIWFLVRRVGIRVAGQPGVWLCSRATGIRPAHIGCAYGPAVACGGSNPRVGMKGKQLLWNNRWMF